MRHRVVIFVALMLVQSCIEKPEFGIIEPEFLAEDVLPNADLGAVMGAFQQAATEILTFEADQEIIASAYVVSSDKGGNFYKTLIIQDNFENPTFGMELKIDLRSYYSKYNVGRRILLRISGLSITEEKGKYIMGYLSAGKLVELPESLLDHHIIRTPETVDIVPKKIDLEDIRTEFLNTFINIDRLQFLKSELKKSYAAEAYDRYTGERSIQQCDRLANSYLMTSAYADFSTYTIPESRFRLSGILTLDYYSGKIGFVLNDLDDLQFLEGERCDPDFFECPKTEENTGSDLVFYENFDRLGSSKDFERIGWENVNVNFGNSKFRKRSDNDNTFAQISAYDSKEYVMEVWLISPPIDLSKSENEYLKFDTRVTFEEGTLLSVWVSSEATNNMEDADWKRLDTEISTGSRDGSNEVFRTSGPIGLDCLEGTIRLAFRYVGSDPGASTTYDLDNVVVLGDKINTNAGKH